jgi:hypothetical protein
MADEETMRKLRREGYDEKFVCEACGETIFVLGDAPSSLVCMVCQAGDRAMEIGRFHEGLRALLMLGGGTDDAPASVQCIYLTEDGKAQREP